LGFMVCGWLADRLGLIRMVLASASAFMLCEAGLVASAFRPATAVLAVLYFLFGLTGAFQILLLVQVRSFFPAALRGRAVTAVNLFGIGGAAFLQWSMGLMIGFYAQDAQGRYPAAAYAVAFGFLLTGTLLAFAWYLPISARLRPHSSATSSAD
jgi:MFS family permease